MTPVYKLPVSQSLLTADDLAMLRRTTLLTSGESNTKTAKQLQALGLHAKLLHLAPAWNSGYNLCPYASPDCAVACLYRAGRASFTVGINQSRIRKSRFFIEQHQEFMTKLVREIANHVAQARKLGKQATLRLNATSDIRWEDVPVRHNGRAYPNLMKAFPTCQFYDYTKVVTRLRAPLPPNYHLTFSLSESNDAHAYEAAQRGFNVAAVLRVKKGQPLPTHFDGCRVIDGDQHDYRFLDPHGVIVGLRPKGPALKDTSGFVHEIDARFDVNRIVRINPRPMITLNLAAD